MMYIRKGMIIAAAVGALTFGCKKETTTEDTVGKDSKVEETHAHKHGENCAHEETPKGHTHADGTFHADAHHNEVKEADAHGMTLMPFGSFSVSGVTFKVEKSPDNKVFKLINNPAKEYVIRGYIVNGKAEESVTVIAGYCSGHKDHTLKMEELPMIDNGSKVVFEVMVDGRSNRQEMPLK